MKYALDYFKNRIDELDSAKLNSLYAYELYNMTQFSYLASKGAYERKESVGAHYIED
jgi:aspartate oxidase